MEKFFVAHFNNGYSVEVYALTCEDNSPCDFRFIPCGLDGKPHPVVSACECKDAKLGITLDYLQLQMEYVDNPDTPRVDTFTWDLSEEFIADLLKELDQR